jgi:hypothetical protein
VKPDQREQLRLSLLRFLAENPTRWGFNLALLTQMARAEGRAALTSGEVEAELLYLEDKGLIAPAEKRLSPELRAWRISAAGRDLLAQTQGV